MFSPRYCRNESNLRRIEDVLGDWKKEKEKERIREKVDTEQVVGIIILSMHGIIDRNKILGRIRDPCASQSLLNDFLITLEES